MSGSICSSNHVFFNTYNAYNLPDIYRIVSGINDAFFNTSVGHPIWFRGQAHEEYILVPSLYRTRKNSINNKCSYSLLSLAEEYRHQNFSARVNHLVQTNPNNRVEWQEILQHHLGKTRFMDWSESLNTAIGFALEAFLDSNDTEDNRVTRRTCSPVIWVMNPQRLNEHVYDFFADSAVGTEYIEHALEGIVPKKGSRSLLASQINREIKKNKDIYFDLGASTDISINGIISACILDKHYHYNLEGIKEKLNNFEFNPFFFLLVRYYSDALPIEVKTEKLLLPPLAAIQPYHSERIRAQKGAFSIFPNYSRSHDADLLSNTRLDPIAIESQYAIGDCFCKVRLCDPNRIMKEFIASGARRIDLYPDLPVYANFIEAQTFHV